MVKNGSLLWRKEKRVKSPLGSFQSLPAISYLSRFSSFCCVQTGRGFYCVLFHFKGFTHTPLRLTPPSGVSFQCMLKLIWKWKSGWFRLYQLGSNSCCCFVGVFVQESVPACYLSGMGLTWRDSCCSRYPGKKPNKTQGDLLLQQGFHLQLSSLLMSDFWAPSSDPSLYNSKDFFLL